MTSRTLLLAALAGAAALAAGWFVWHWSSAPVPPENAPQLGIVSELLQVREYTDPRAPSVGIARAGARLPRSVEPVSHAGCGGGWYAYTHRATAQEKAAVPDRLVARAEKRDIDASIEVSGDVAPEFQLEVKPEVGGKRPRAMDFRTFGIGAQIVRALGVRRMRVVGAPKQMHGLSGFGLEVVEYVSDAAEREDAHG